MTDDTPRRRKTDIPLAHVELESLGVNAKKFADHITAALFGMLLALVTATPATLWAGSRWTARIEGAIEAVSEDLNHAVSEMRDHVAMDDVRTSQIAEAVTSLDKTMTRVVVNQENLQSRVNRLERLDDNDNRNNK